MQNALHQEERTLQQSYKQNDRHHCAAASAQTHRLFRDAMIFCAFEKIWELITSKRI
jgi:hypothetical protein